ncbi:MAG: FadR family transcriptional regulator [Tagaea sp.]|nr:FadR family transcriptional regulator [Tagaea sp.]
MNGEKRATGIHADAVAHIARKILRGRLKAGAVLPTEPEIGAELGVSRTVVREAVKTLAAKGLVVTGPRLGMRVRPMPDWNLFDSDVIGWRVAAGVDTKFLEDVVELRLAIEPMAARLAAKRADDDAIGQIEEAYTAMVDAVDGKGGYLAADLAFHQAILLAAGNQFVSAFAPLLGALLGVSFRHSVKSRESARASLPQHEAVLRAIAARKPVAAEKALTRLIGHAREDMFDGAKSDGFLEEDGE